MPRAALYRGKKGCLVFGYLSEHFRIALQVSRPYLILLVRVMSVSANLVRHCNADDATSPVVAPRTCLDSCILAGSSSNRAWHALRRDRRVVRLPGRGCRVDCRRRGCAATVTKVIGILPPGRIACTSSSLPQDLRMASRTDTTIHSGQCHRS